MADHSLDRQIGIDRLANDITTLKQQLSELRTLQLQGNDALNLQLSSTDTATISLPDNGTQTIVYSIANANNRRLFGFPSITLYQDSVAVGNEIMRATALSANYQWNIWCDWGTTDNNNIVYYVWFKNNSGSTQSILFRGNWRYIVSSASTA